MRWEIRNIAENTVNVILLVITLFLTGRVLFQVLSANPSTPFVSWINNTSAFFMTPFRGMFSPLNLPQGPTIDINALFTIIAYALISFLLIYLIRLATRRFYHQEELHGEEVTEGHINEHEHPAHRDVHAHYR